MRSYLLVLTAAASCVTLPAAAASVPLPVDLSGSLNGTEYRIRVPEHWNGTLLVYAHGTASAGVEIAPPTFPVASPALEEQLLSRGYALAGSFFDGLLDGAQRTLALTSFFNGQVGRPERVIVWGLSLGGSVSLNLIETAPGTYDAAIALSPVAGGLPKDVDFALRYGLAYEAAFGWPSDWWGPVEDLRDDLLGNEATLIAPVFRWFDGTNYGEWEFIRLVMKLPWSVWWDFEPLLGLPGWALDGWKATALRSSAEQDFGGPVAQNEGVVYELAPEDKAYLAGLGLDADALLGAMNTRDEIVARRSARNHLAHHGLPSGDLRGPVLTVHGILDPMLPPAHEAVYRDLVSEEGKEELLVQVYVNSGHASFSAEQLLSVLVATEQWLDSGSRPDASFLPESQGFDNSFSPPTWPY